MIAKKNRTTYMIADTTFFSMVNSGEQKSYGQSELFNFKRTTLSPRHLSCGNLLLKRSFVIFVLEKENSFKGLVVQEVEGRSCLKIPKNKPAILWLHRLSKFEVLQVHRPHSLLSH